MKPGTSYGLLIGAAAIGIAAYLFINAQKKQRAIEIISQSGYADTPLFVNRDTDYLISWADAIRSKRLTFIWKGHSYLTETGYRPK